MNPFVECAPCILKWIYERVSFSADEDQKYALIRTIMDILSRDFVPSGNVALISKRILDTVNEFVLAAEAGYNEIKNRTNQAAKGLLPASREYTRKSKNSRGTFS